MKSGLAFLAGAVVGGLLVGSLMRAPRATELGEAAVLEPPSEPVAHSRGEGALDSQVDGRRNISSVAADEPGEAAGDQNASTPASGLPGDLEGLSAELERLLGSDDDSWWRLRSVLKALARLDDPRGLERVLDCMREDCVGLGAARFADILAGVRDARILGAANETLEANLAGAKDSWKYTWGYLDIIAGQGGQAAAGILLSHLGSQGQLGHGAAEAVALLDDPNLAPAFFEQIRTGDSFRARELAKALASWGDAGIIAELLDLGFGTTIEAERRRSVLKGTAEGLPAAFHAQFVARVEGDPRPEVHIAGLSALGYLGREALGSVALPAILAALGSPNQAIATAVLSTVDDHAVLHTAEVELLLAAWLPNITNPDLRERVTRTLAHVRNR